MKTFLTAAFIFSFGIYATAQITITNSNWDAHVEVPYSADISLVFKKDSFTIFSIKGREVESMLFSQQHDSLFLHRISGMMPCIDGAEALYRIE